MKAYARTYVLIGRDARVHAESGSVGIKIFAILRAHIFLLCPTNRLPSCFNSNLLELPQDQHCFVLISLMTSLCVLTPLTAHIEHNLKLSSF